MTEQLSAFLNDTTKAGQVALEARGQGVPHIRKYFSFAFPGGQRWHVVDRHGRGEIFHSEERARRAFVNVSNFTFNDVEAFHAHTVQV